ncbi:MAG: DNA polymerase III subunit alpha [Candidatus Nomurabacteria bacterium]|nr:MAG: DNA polymerase III subunit alpha [Candidatus Nomurabacteria bacterium]
MRFAHLHVHSHYSLLDGLPKIDELVARAVELDMPAVALTDHGVLYGAVEFYQKATAAGIKPIIGIEAYLARNSRHSKQAKVDERPYHLILLAENNTGYKNLIALTTRAHLEGYYYRPRIDWELLEQYSEGLIAMTACIGGHIPSLILSGEEEELKRTIERYKKVFGPDHFYFELQSNPSLPQQQTVNTRLIELSREYDVPLVVTNDCHYLSTEDADAQDILLCLQTKSKKNDKDRMSYLGENFALRSTEEMASLFPDLPEAIANTAAIAERCNVTLELGKIHLPHYEVPQGKTANAYLRELCMRGLRDRYDTKPDKEVLDRLDYELSVIEKTGFATYLLIVQDFITWAKENRIVVGPGRGSAASSLVCYLLNITDIDPLRYDLLFERFLNPERISMPDIDTDFSDVRRDEVIRYVESKYGKDHVAQIITFGTMAARAAIRDVGRVLDLPYMYCDRVAKLIPMGMTIDEAVSSVPELREINDNDPQAKELLDNARKLEGVARHASTHACGVVITKEPLEEYVPVQFASASDQTVITQYSLHPIEDLGLLKMDFLGLSNLTIIETTLKIVEKTRGEHIVLQDLPLDDKKAYSLLQRGNTIGVFQLESSGMRRYLISLKPNELEDLIAMVALYRPGPMELIPEFIDGKHGRRQAQYLHPKLKPILDKTYGVAVYQEQVLQMARDLAGFSMGEADVLRKAVGKKIGKLLQEQKEKFVEGCVKNDIKEATAKKIFDFIEPFARYGFNRAHAACYGLIAYQTAFLKANYTAEFMAALMTSDHGSTDRIALEIEECRHLGIEVLPPDINESFATFTVVTQKDQDAEPNRIRFGLNAIKNVGEGVVEAIIAERKQNGSFANLEDFLERVQSKDVNKKSLEALIKAGALDCVGGRSALLHNLETILSFAKQVGQEKDQRQTNLFGMLPNTHARKLTLMEAEPLDKMQRLSWERELLGLYLSDHPLSQYREALAKISTPILGLDQAPRSRMISIAGIVTQVQRITTRKGDAMLFVRIEDMSGSVEVLVFPKLYLDTSHEWIEESLVLVKGKVSDKDGIPKILADSVKALDPNKLQAASPALPRNTDSPMQEYVIRLPKNISPATLDALKQVLQAHEGDARVRLTMEGTNGQSKETNYYVRDSEALRNEVAATLASLQD